MEKIKLPQLQTNNSQPSTLAKTNKNPSSPRENFKKLHFFDESPSQNANSQSTFLTKDKTLSRTNLNLKSLNKSHHEYNQNILNTESDIQNSPSNNNNTVEQQRPRKKVNTITKNINQVFSPHSQFLYDASQKNLRKQSQVLTLEQKKKIYYRKIIANQKYSQMITLPVIIKEQDLYNRKNTIAVFKPKKKPASIQPQNLQQHILQNKKQETLDEGVGRMYSNELWSEKFAKFILKESQIQNNLDKISKLYRRNIEETMHQISYKSPTNKDIHLNFIDGIVQKYMDKQQKDFEIKNIEHKSKAKNILFDQSSIVNENHINNQTIEEEIILTDRIMSGRHNSEIMAALNQSRENINNKWANYSALANTLRDTNNPNDESAQNIRENATSIIQQQNHTDEDDDVEDSGRRLDTEQRQTQQKSKNKEKVKEFKNQLNDLIGETQQALKHKMKRDYQDLRDYRKLKKQQTQQQLNNNNSQQKISSLSPTKRNK